METNGIKEYLESSEGAVIFTNPSFDDAIIGSTYDDRVVYSYSKMVISLINNEGMTFEEAVEFIDYNTIRSLDYVKNAPIVVFERYREEE